MTGIAVRLVSGAAAGLVATAAMSAQMVAKSSTDRVGTPPPQRLADVFFSGRSESDRKLAAAVIHLGIGAVSGAIYGCLARRGGPVTGALYGVAIWAIGYELLVPMTGVLPPAHRDRRARREAMIEAHIVYGAVLGTLS